MESRGDGWRVRAKDEVMASRAKDGESGRRMARRGKGWVLMAIQMSGSPVIRRDLAPYHMTV